MLTPRLCCRGEARYANGTLVQVLQSWLNPGSAPVRRGSRETCFTPQASVSPSENWDINYTHFTRLANYSDVGSSPHCTYCSPTRSGSTGGKAVCVLVGGVGCLDGGLGLQTSPLPSLGLFITHCSLQPSCWPATLPPHGHRCSRPQPGWWLPSALSCNPCCWWELPRALIRPW